MTITVQIEDLRKIFPTELIDEQLTMFINTAQLFCESVYADDTQLSEAVKNQIALYLSAHFASVASPRMASESFGDGYKYVIQGKTDMGWNATFYGQTALALDTEGLLLETGKRLATLDLIDERDTLDV